jgi:hypothetical protein
VDNFSASYDSANEAELIGVPVDGGSGKLVDQVPVEALKAVPMDAPVEAALKTASLSLAAAKLKSASRQAGDEHVAEETEAQPDPQAPPPPAPPEEVPQEKGQSPRTARSTRIPLLVTLMACSLPRADCWALD